MNIKPIRNVVMFQFLDATGGSKGKFDGGKTEGGIIIPVLDSEQKIPRWGEVVALGPDAASSGLNVGDFILVEALMWSFGTKINDEKMWKTDDTKILMVTNDRDVTNKTSF